MRINKVRFDFFSCLSTPAAQTRSRLSGCGLTVTHACALVCQRSSAVSRRRTARSRVRTLVICSVRPSLLLLPRSSIRTCFGTLVRRDEARVKTLNVPSEQHCEAAMHDAPVQNAPEQTLTAIVCAIAVRRDAGRGTNCLRFFGSNLISNMRTKFIIEC